MKNTKAIFQEIIDEKQLRIYDLEAKLLWIESKITYALSWEDKRKTVSILEETVRELEGEVDSVQ